jgi:SAM-dependent methyltransferase/uncharacterized protein YbaR (Trm112 family)
MRPDFVNLLQCPACQATLALHGFESEHPRGEDVKEGLLVCQSCRWPFPIVDGIPRLLPNAIHRQRRFAHKYRQELTRIGRRDVRRRDFLGFERLHGLTARAFGYEWNVYKTTSYEEDVLTFFWLTGADPAIGSKFKLDDVFSYYPSRNEIAAINSSLLSGKRGLEVGCGMGKYLKIVGEHAAEVIGLDISDSLARARAETAGRGNIHLVQGNILAPPLKPSTMDFVYSLGVLHHTPDCHQAFRRSAGLVAPGGWLAVWLYPKDPTPGAYAKWVHWIQDDVLRPITCRTPPRVLRFFCSGLGRLTFVRDHYADQYRATGSRLAYRIAMAAGALAVGRHKDPEIAAFLNFDWYSPQYRSYHTEQELRSWFEEIGFREARILPQRVSGIAHAA